MERKETSKPADKVRHVAVHQLITPTGETVGMCVVDLVGGEVAGWHAMQGEEPFTEWRGGTLDIRNYDIKR